MLSVSNEFKTAEASDSKKVASRVRLALGDYASSAMGATCFAGSVDVSGDYPANGAINGDRTELNVGPASGADNDIGKSSWRSNVHPTMDSPIDFRVVFDIYRPSAINKCNRIKIYHLAGHALKSFKITDCITFATLASTADIGGGVTIVSTGKVDVIDLPTPVTGEFYIWVYDTVVPLDKANIVEIEAYYLIDISDKVASCQVNKSRDYKLSNPIASTAVILADNSDGYFNSETIYPNLQVLVDYGYYTASEDSPEYAQQFIGYIDSVSIDSAGRTATLQCRDLMKHLINKITTSKLKTSIDIADAMQYALNLANVSSMECDLDATTILLDYFFLDNSSVLTTVRDLVSGCGDAIFYVDENGRCVFKFYINSAPQQEIVTTQAEWQAGSVLTNIDSASTPDSIQRKWFLIDNFTDGNLNNNPPWNLRTQTSSKVENTYAQFNAGTVKQNLYLTQSPDTIEKGWMLIDDFPDPNGTWIGSVSRKPAWITGLFLHVYSNKMRISQSDFDDDYGAKYFVGANYGTWECKFKVDSVGMEARFYVYGQGFGSYGRLNNSYFVRLTQNSLQWVFSSNGVDLTYIRAIDGTYTNTTGERTVKVTRSIGNVIKIYVDGSLRLTTAMLDNNSLPPSQNSIAIGVYGHPGISGQYVWFDDFRYSPDPAAPSYSTDPYIFESDAIDQTANFASLGSLSSVTELTTYPTWGVTFYTATSTDGITFDSYVQVASDGRILSVPKRYIKYKSVFTTPDVLPYYPNRNGYVTPKITSVTITWYNTLWSTNSGALFFQPLSGAGGAIDTAGNKIIGTWRARIKSVPGTTGPKTRMYFMGGEWSSGYSTYPDSYYVELDQNAGTIAIWKVSSAGSRSLLNSFAMAIPSDDFYSLRVTKDNTGLISVYWNEVLKVQDTDTSIATSSIFAFEVDPNGDSTCTVRFDDVYFSNEVDGTVDISSSQAVYESDGFDLSVSVASLGLLEGSVYYAPNTSINFFTATSDDDITYDAYVAVNLFGQIASTVRRYIKFKAVLVTPQDSGTYNDFNTPVINDIELNYFTTAGSPKWPQSVSFIFKDTDALFGLQKTLTDELGGDSSIVNDVSILANPLILTGADADTVWQGTTGTPPAIISAGNPLGITNGQTLYYDIYISGGMDTSRMSGASPAAVAITFGGGGAGTYTISRISPTRPKIKIVVTGTGTITDLRLTGKKFGGSNYFLAQSSSDSDSINIYGSRTLQISNPYIVSPAFALAVANKIVSNYKDPTDYIPSCVIDSAYSLQLGDRVKIIDTGAGLNNDYIIVGVTHNFSISMDSGSIETNLMLLKVVV